MFPNLLTTNNIRQQNIDKGSDSSAQSCKCNSIGSKGDTMNSESSIRFPADFSYITAEEELTIQGGTEIEAIDSIVSNITKISRVLNYLARIFAASSSMLNNLITVYNTAKQLDKYIQQNF